MNYISKSNILQTLCIVVMLISVMSCKKEEPPKFSGEDFLFFNRPVFTYSSFLSIYNKDAIKTNIENDFPLIVQMDGRLSNKDRPFLLELEGNGKEYVIMPHPDSLYIKGNKIDRQLDITLIRPILTDTEIKTVTLILKNNNSFKPVHHLQHKVTFTFGNWFDKPQLYDREVFGKFSAAKIGILHEAVNRKGSTYWEANPNVITLNNYSQQRGKTPLKFNPFTFNDLYNFIDNQVLWDGITIGALRNAYNDLSSEFIALSKLLLIEKRNAGHPVLDDSGSEISFP